MFNMELKLVDVHCHLEHADFANDLDAVITRAREAGLKAIVVSGVNPATNIEVLDLCKRYPDILKCTLGIFPIDAVGLPADGTGLAKHEGKIDLDAQFEFIRKNTDKIVGIGEVGMDFHWDAEHHNEQKENFEKIISFVEKIGLPIVVHTRKAESECFSMLKNSSIKKVVLHSFGGRKSLIKEAADLGYKFSVPANIVRSDSFQSLVKNVDLSRILTETDSPWLAPTPGRNEPANVAKSIEVIAKIKGMTQEETALCIFKNYMEVFG